MNIHLPHWTHGLIDFILDPVRLMTDLTNNYSHYVYIIIFVLVLLESCSLWFSWIPAQSILFITGTLSTQSDNVLHPWLLWIGFFIVAQLGNIVKYHHGEHLGPFKNKHANSSARYLTEHERASLILSNFLPVIGLLIPIMAGREKLEFKRYLKLTTIGEIIWVTVIIMLGFFLGRFEWVTKHYAAIVVMVALAPIVISTLWKYAVEIFGAIKGNYSKN
jgi:membrane-associated protein